MFQRFTFVVCLLVAVVPTSVCGQVKSDTTIHLPEATVTAERDASSTGSAVARVTAISVQNATREQNRTLADLLDTSTGVYIRRYGSSGSAGIALRGTDPNQTEILLDGLRITDPQSGQVDLSLIPVVLLESVEILHGAGSSSESSGGLGGTVRLRTVAAEREARAKIRASSGAYGSRSLSGLATGGSDLVSGLIAVEHSEEDGAFPYVNEAVYPPARTFRSGADMMATSILGKMSFAGGGHRAAVAGWLNRVERGLPGPGNAAPVPSRQEDSHFRTWVNTHHVLPGATMSTDWSIQTSELRYTDKSSGTDELTETASLEGRIRGNMPLGRSAIVQTGFDLTRHVTGDVDENRIAAFGSAAAETSRLLVEGSLRAESWLAESTTRSQVVPRAGINIKRFVHPSVRLKMSAGRTWTVPSLIDRYWVPGGNPDLSAERGWSGDLGLHYGREGIELEVTGFSARLSDRIVWIPSLVGSGVQVWRPTNVGEVHTYGVESSAAAHALLAEETTLRAVVSLAYTEARDRSDRASVSYGHQLKYTPRTVCNASLDLTRGAFRLGLSGELVGRRYITSDETSSLPTYAVFSARASYDIPIGPLSATISATADNILNEEYATIRFYPMPPRHFGFGLNLEWTQEK